MSQRYEVQTINPTPTESTNYRVTDTHTDSRIATCYVRENADLIVRALNFYDHTGGK